MLGDRTARHPDLGIEGEEKMERVALTKRIMNSAFPTRQFGSRMYDFRPQGPNVPSCSLHLLCCRSTSFTCITACTGAATRRQPPYKAIASDTT